MQYKDRKKQSEYQTKWMQRRREQWLRENGPCSCGNGELADLEVDHIEPNKKVSHRIWSWSDEKRLLELSKCQVLCSSCHMKKTLDQRPKTDHGRTGMYNCGCRCDVCREAHRIRVAEWRKRVA